MRRLACLALLTGFAVAGCGGGGGGGGLTKAQYDAKLSYLCLAAADQVRELHLDVTVASWKHDGAALTRIEQSFKRRLAALEPPRLDQGCGRRLHEGERQGDGRGAGRGRRGERRGRGQASDAPQALERRQPRDLAVGEVDRRDRVLYPLALHAGGEEERI